MTRVQRLAAALIGLALLSWAWTRFGERAAKAYQVWRYPAITAKPALGKALSAEVDAVRRAELRAHYARVKDALDRAAAQGLPTAALYSKLPDAARMINNGRFEYARVYLSSIEARVPRLREAVAAAGVEAEEPPPRPRRAPRRGTR